MKLIIDCDPGNGIPGANVDDAIALAYAVRQPAFDVRAIWTVFGNTSATEGRAAAEALLASLGTELPVRRGAEEPLAGRRAHWRSILDAPSQDPAVYRLWGPQAPRRDGAARLGADPLPALIEDLEDAGEDVVLGCLGPLTNVARLVREAPESLAGVRAIHLMGGCLGAGQLVDTNFAVDPAATRMVLRAGIPLTVVPLDVTRTTELPPARWRSIRDLGHPDLDAVAAWLEPWLVHSDRTRPVDGMWLHDLVVLAALADPGLVTRERVRVAVLDDPAGKLVLDPEGVAVDLVTGVDNDALIAAWVDAILGRDRARRPPADVSPAPTLRR